MEKVHGNMHVFVHAFVLSCYMKAQKRASFHVFYMKAQKRAFWLDMESPSQPPRKASSSY